MKNSYTKHEVERKGIKIILEMPPKNERDENVKKELKAILCSTLKEQLQKIS